MEDQEPNPAGKEPDLSNPAAVAKDLPVKKWRVAGGPQAVKMAPNEIQMMAMFFCPIGEIAEYYGVTERQIYRRFAKSPELKAAFEKGRAMGKRHIRRVQFKKAVNDESTDMLKWLGQNYLGQSNRVSVLAEELNPAAMDDAYEAEFVELFDEIDEEMEADGYVIEQSPSTGSGLDGEGEEQGPHGEGDSTGEGEEPSA